MRKYDFPYAVESLADLPGGLQPPAAQFLKPDDPPSSILFFPRHTQTRLRNRRSVAPQALLFTASGVLHVQEADSPAQPPVVTYLRGADLLYAQHTLILLYGRLELAGVVDGHLARLVVEYNTVRQYLLQPSLEQLLRLAYGPRLAESGPADRAGSLLARLGPASDKFSAGLRLYALLPDEQLQGLVFQPCIVQRLRFGLSRPIAPAAMLALTDRALILIEEDKCQSKSYGWRITCCPRLCVASMETQPRGEWRGLCVRLARGQVTIDQPLTLDDDTAQAWQAVTLKGAAEAAELPA